MRKAGKQEREANESNSETGSLSCKEGECKGVRKSLSPIPAFLLSSFINLLA
jgi:hypothetical protein